MDRTVRAQDMNFKLSSDYEPQGDQPQAIEQLVRGVESGEKHQVLLGVTGSGKTFTMAKVIAAVNRPAIVLAHNKKMCIRDSIKIVEQQVYVNDVLQKEPYAVHDPQAYYDPFGESFPPTDSRNLDALMLSLIHI